MLTKRQQQQAQEEATQQSSQQPHSSFSSFSSAVGQVPGPINILGDVLSRGRDEFQEGLRSVRNNLPQQQQQHVQNLKNLGTKLQQGETKVQEGLRTLGSKIQQNVPVLGGGTDRGDIKQPKVVLQDGIRSIGNKLQQFNISKIVDTSTGTNDFESLNSIVKEHQEFHILKRQAEEACLQEMKVHLQEFLRKYKHEHDGFHPTYEEWIENIHPENAYEGKLLTDYKEKEIDLRFFLQDSDHRKLWNETVPKERFVKARNQHLPSSSLTTMKKNQPLSSSSQIPYSDDPAAAGATSGRSVPGIVDLLSSSGTFDASANDCAPSNTVPTNATIDDPFDDLFGNPITTSSETTTTMTSTAPTTSQSHPIMDDLFGMSTSPQVSTTTATEATATSSLTASGNQIDNLFGYDSVPPASAAGVGSATAAVGLATTTPTPSGDNDNKPQSGDADLINFF